MRVPLRLLESGGRRRRRTRRRDRRRLGVGERSAKGKGSAVDAPPRLSLEKNCTLILATSHRPKSGRAKTQKCQAAKQRNQRSQQTSETSKASKAAKPAKQRNQRTETEKEAKPSRSVGFFLTDRPDQIAVIHSGRQAGSLAGRQAGRRAYRYF